LEPQHEEARAYLAQVREMQKTYRPAQARASENAEIQKLYDEGRRLYRTQKYEEAIEVFNKILSLKPIDDFASYYRERCEILLARKIAREKKLEERQRRLEEKKEDRSARSEKKKAAVTSPEESASAGTAALDDSEGPAGGRERKGEEKLQLKEERRQEKLRIKAEKRAQAARRREAKRLAKEERRQEKLRLKEEKRAEAQRRREEKQRAKDEKLARRQTHRTAKEEKVAAAQTRREQEEVRLLDKRTARNKLNEERRQIKDRFLEGVTAYGRKDYKTAMAAFRDVIQAEKKTGLRYTRSADRLIEKSRKKLEGMGKDVAL